MVDSGFAPQRPIGYHTDLQEEHLVVGNFDKGWPATVDNFDTGQIDFSPGVSGIYTVAGLHIEPGNQAAFDKKVGMDTHLAAGDQFDFGAGNRVELEKQEPSAWPVEQAQRDILAKTKVGPSGWKVVLVGSETDLLAQKVELARCLVVLADQMAD